MNVNGERVEVEVEPGRRRRRFETTPDVRDHLAALRRKEMLLRQDRYVHCIYCMIHACA